MEWGSLDVSSILWVRSFRGHGYDSCHRETCGNVGKILVALHTRIRQLTCGNEVQWPITPPLFDPALRIPYEIGRSDGDTFRMKS